MQVFFLGVGEACDSHHGNCSVLVRTKNTTLLLDCGFSVPHRFFRYCDDPDCLDNVWISHFHGDHFLGLPLLLLRFWEMGRKRPLEFIGQEHLEDKTLAALELAYPGFAEKLSFPLHFQTVTPGLPLKTNDLQLQAAVSGHSQKNYGLCITNNTNRLYYSGDGRATEATRKLMHGCDLVLHEAFTLCDSIPGHGSVESCLQLMDEENIKQLALLHIERKTRHREQQTLEKIIAENPGILLPKEDDVISIR